jgi:hypothetical protein
MDTGEFGGTVCNVMSYQKTCDYRLPAYFAENLRLLADLQSVHDYKGNWKSDDTMRARLREVADDYELDTSVLDTLSFPKVEEKVAA